MDKETKKLLTIFGIVIVFIVILLLWLSGFDLGSLEIRGKIHIN